MDKFIPLSIPNFEGNERKYVDDAIKQGWVSTGGAYITKLEQEMAKFLQVENVAACQSGTSALHLSLVEAGVKPGDVVIVPPLTFIAAVNPVKYQFARPVFIDCDRCRRGRNFGGIRLYNSYVDMRIPVTAVLGGGAFLGSTAAERMRHTIRLMECYQAFRLKKLSTSAWMKETGKLVERLVAMDESDISAR